jgi:hypothetical protein
VKHSVPRSAARSPRLRQSRKRFLRKEAASTRRKPRSELGTHEVRVHVYRSGGRSRSNASRVLSTGRSQGLVVGSRALAGRKLEAPPDAGHEPREGETVCGKALIVKNARFAGLRVYSQVFDTTEGVLGLMPVLPSRVGRRRGPSARRSISATPSARSVCRVAHRSAQRPVGRAYE